MKTNKQWYPYKDLGAYFRLEDDTLMQSPMNADGSRESEAAEVDWTRGVADEQDKQRLIRIVNELQDKQ